MIVVLMSSHHGFTNSASGRKTLLSDKIMIKRFKTWARICI